MFNRGKVYTLTLGQCTQALKDKLKEDSNWESIASAYDIIGLLQLIEKYVLKQTESHYPYLAVQEEMQSMLNFSQGEDMSLGMFYKNITTRIAITDCAGCIFTTPALLDVEADVMFPSGGGGTTDFKSLTTDQAVRVSKTCRDKYLATLYLMRSGKHHTQLKNDIKNDHAKGVENSFPTTVASAMQIMNDFKLVMTETGPMVSLGTAFAQGGATKKTTKGQLSDEAWNALSLEDKTKLVESRKAGRIKTAAAAAGGKLSKSGDDGNKSVNSTKSMNDLQKDNVRLKRQLKSTKAALVTTISEGNKSDLSDDKGSSNFVAAMAILQDEYPELYKGIVVAHKSGAMEKLNLRNSILINSQTTHDVFCNKKYDKNIRKAVRTIHLSTNGGTMKITCEADVPGLYPVGSDATVYFDHDTITNILSFKKLAKKYRITYDSDMEKTLIVHRKAHGLVDLHFSMHPCGLHILKQVEPGKMFVQTVEDNLKLYSKQQIEGAKKARAMYEMLHCPSDEDFFNIINQGGIRGSKVTVEDIKIAKNIWGPSVIKAKGNTVRRPAKLTPSSIVSVPKELLEAQKNVTLSIGFFFINQKHIFLMTYSDNICFTTNTHVGSRKVKDYWSFLKDVYKRYLVCGLSIRKIKADLEFTTLQVLVIELPTRPTMVLAAQGEHVGLVEHNICFLKEKVRLLRYTLPFTKVPKYMIIHMVFLVTQVMNYFPRKGGNAYYSPGMIVTGTGVLVDTLHIPFGLYVQSTESVEPRNSLAA
jgi:hypothetical protein